MYHTGPPVGIVFIFMENEVLGLVIRHLETLLSTFRIDPSSIAGAMIDSR